jgi:phage terminase small subunit
MVRQRSPARDEAKKLYLDSKGTMKLVDIAAKLNIKDSQVRKWKSQDNWDDGLDDKSKGALPNSNSNVTNQKVTKKKIKKEPIADEVKEVLENTELTDKQRLFCVIYAKRQNATKAYQKVYHCTYETAMVNGSQLLRNTKIREQIDRLLEAELNKEFLKKGLIQQYKDIAFSDIGDYLEFGKKQVPQWTKDKDGVEIPVIDPDTGEQKIKEYSYVDLKDSIGVDTSLITEVSEGKDGIKFKLADKMKAMEVLAKLSNLLSDEEKIKLDLEYKRLQNAKLEAEIAKVDKNDEPIQIVIKRKEREE